MTLELTGRVAIVTGAGRGIGQATAIAFSKAGSHVVLSGQSREPLMQTLALIQEYGGRGAVVVGDRNRRRWAEWPGPRRSPPPRCGCARMMPRTSPVL